MRVDNLRRFKSDLYSLASGETNPLFRTSDARLLTDPFWKLQLDVEVSKEFEPMCSLTTASFVRVVRVSGHIYDSLELVEGDFMVWDGQKKISRCFF